MTEQVAAAETPLEKKRYNRLIFVCWLAYTAMMAAKMIFVAQTVEIITWLGLTKAQVSVPNTFYYVTYGIMQAVIAPFIGRLDIKKLFAVILPCSAAVYFTLPLFGSIGAISFLWALNGVFQSAIWAGCLVVLSKYLPDEMTNKANIVMSTGFAIGTVIAYGASSLFIALINWKATFIFFGGVLVAAAAVFYIVVLNTEKNVPPIDKKQLSQAIKSGDNGFSKKSRAAFYGLVLLTALVTASMYYGVVNWIPNLLFDVYAIPASYSLLITVSVPLLVTLGPVLLAVSLKRHKNIISVCLAYVSGMIPILLLLVFFYNTNILLALMLSILFCIIIRGVANVFGSVIPFQMRNLINSGASGAAINAASSLGAAVMPLFVGMAIDGAGWRAGYTVMLAFCITSVTLLFITGIVWKKFFKKR